MYFKRMKKLYITIIGCICLLANSAAICSEEVPVALWVKPAQCVSLHKGHKCYQTVVFNWSGLVLANYCLLNADTGQSLHCWYDQELSSYLFSFVSESSNDFHLVELENGNKKVLAKVTVEVAWVYRSKRNSKSGWRLF